MIKLYTIDLLIDLQRLKKGAKVKEMSHDPHGYTLQSHLPKTIVSSCFVAIKPFNLRL